MWMFSLWFPPNVYICTNRYGRYEKTSNQIRHYCHNNYQQELQQHSLCSTTKPPSPQAFLLVRPHESPSRTIVLDLWFVSDFRVPISFLGFLIFQSMAYSYDPTTSIDPFFHSLGSLDSGLVQRGGSILSQSLVLNCEKGEIVKAPIHPSKKRVSEEKALAALRNHSEAERRRRQRINSHLTTLRGLVPCLVKVSHIQLQFHINLSEFILNSIIDWTRLLRN